MSDLINSYYPSIYPLPITTRIPPFPAQDASWAAVDSTGAKLPLLVDESAINGYVAANRVYPVAVEMTFQDAKKLPTNTDFVTARVHLKENNKYKLPAVIKLLDEKVQSNIAGYTNLHTDGNWYKLSVLDGKNFAPSFILKLLTLRNASIQGIYLWHEGLE
jgi:hypothetical protein